MTRRILYHVVLAGLFGFPLMGSLFGFEAGFFTFMGTAALSSYLAITETNRMHSETKNEEPPAAQR
jgi:hypothetical protein